MSGAAVRGLVTAGLVLGVLGVSALAWRRDSERLRTIRAQRWAKEAGLALPSESVGPLAARIRRETLVGFALMALFGPVTLGLMTWRFFAPPPGSDGSLLHGPGLPLICLAVTTVVNALGQVWSQRRGERMPEDRVWRAQPVTVAMAVPPWALWMARALSVISPLATLAVLSGVPGGGTARELSRYVCVVLFVAGALIQYGVERRRAAMLNRPQLAGSVHLLAFDDVFRVRAVLELLRLVPALSYLASAFVLQAVDSAANRAQPQLALDPLESWLLPLGIAVFLFNIVLGTPGVRRYYRRGWAAPQPTLPPPADPHAGPY
jgi:hypothetical protein